MLDLRTIVFLLPALAFPQAEIAPSASSRARNPGGQLTVEGRVIYEDGLPAGAGVDIRSCAPGVQTGADGKFTVSTDDSSIPCFITASKSGFKSSEVKIMVGSGSFDIGDLTLRQEKDPEALARRTAISDPSLDAPEPAWKAFEKGRRAVEKRKWKDAEKRLREAVGIYARFAQAWGILGDVYRETDRADDARAAYERALQEDPEHVPPRLGLAALALRGSNWTEAEVIATKVIRQSPAEFPRAYLYRATALYNTGKHLAATEAAFRGVEIDSRKQVPKLQHLLGVMLAKQGRNPEALVYLRNYLNYGAGPDAREVRRQIASIEAAAKSAR